MRPPCPQPFFITTSCVHLRVRFVRIFHHHHHHHHHHHRLILYYGSFIIDDIVHTACPARSCIDFAHFHALVEFGGYGFHALHPFVTDPDIIGGRRRRRRRYFAGHGSGGTRESHQPRWSHDEHAGEQDRADLRRTESE